MSKIGFIVEPYFHQQHFGVRNFFCTIKNVLSEQHETDFLMYIRSGIDIGWYRVSLDELENVQETIAPIIYECGKSEAITYNTYLQFLDEYQKKQKTPMRYFQYIGKSLESEQYNTCIITNPWLLGGYPEIHCSKLYGMVYDFIANLFIFDKVDKPFDWANMHRQGYEFYNQNCDYIIADSKEVALQYQDFYKEISPLKIKYFPPFIPYQYKNISYTNEKKENAVILAAPFDLRKGLKRIPTLLNALKKDIERIYIFGMPRCTIEDFNDFFKRLSISKIVYYPSISYAGLIKLYKKCKFLLFPSSEEGLGIPLLEAQVCGCRIVTTDQSPMNTLGVEGYYYLSGDDSNDVKYMRKMLKEDFDYQLLSMNACQRFSFYGIKKIFEGETNG